MKRLAITEQDFKRHINDIVNLMDFQEKLIEFSAEYNRLSHDEVEFMIPSLIDNVIELLEQAVCDNDEWISYWLFDLDRGRYYKPDSVTESDGTPIPLATINDLWELLSKD